MTTNKENMAARREQARKEREERSERARREYEAICASRRRRAIPAEGKVTGVKAAHQ